MRALLCLGVLGAALAIDAGEARATEGAFVLRNPSSTTIHYQVRWGDGDWQSYSLPPETRRTHYHALDADGRAPAPQVRFDYICGDGEVTYRMYNVDFYAVYDPFRGKPYVFRHTAGGRLLDLYRE
jgi:hypothetical protein